VPVPYSPLPIQQLMGPIARPPQAADLWRFPLFLPKFVEHLLHFP
jgi:hypothetical protein